MDTNTNSPDFKNLLISSVSILKDCAFLLDDNFIVVWFNNRARDQFKQIKQGAAVENFIPELDSRSLLSELKEGTSVTFNSNELMKGGLGITFLPFSDGGEMFYLATLSEKADSITNTDPASILSLGIKSPLMRMINRLSATEKQDKVEYNRDLAPLYDECRRLLRVSVTLIDYWDYLNASKQSVFLSCDVGLLTKTICDRADEMLRTTAGVRVECSVKNGMNITAVDTNRFSTALLHLISNAAKYRGLSDTVHVNVKTQGNFIFVSVADSGIGVDDTKNIFSAYFTGDKEQNEMSEAMGLGLTIARQMALLHGGNIVSSSAENNGFMVVFSLPVVDTDNLDFYVEASNMLDENDRFSKLWVILSDVNDIKGGNNV